MLFSKIIKKKFDAVLGRYDGDPAYHYDSVKDFPGLQAQNFNIQGDKQVQLVGYFYYYNELKPENLIVFDHGIGAGHEAYLKEINYLAQHGYTVYSYDHTGCVASKGDGILGFAQGINDLDHVLTALQKDARFSTIPRKIIGHSWGGYACMNVCALHPEVTHVVSLAGFISARALNEQYIPNPFLKYSEEVMERERQHNPVYADMDARESLLKSKTKLLHLQSRDDVKVKFELCTEVLQQALANRENTQFIVLDHHNHDPQRTVKAESFNAKMLQDLNALRKKNKLSTKDQLDAFRNKYDWNQITEQDENVWEQVLAFLQK